MKAIIPVAGAGTRLRPLTYTQPKPLIPVAGKPIISFIIDQLLAAGVEEFVFIIGYLGEKIETYVTENYPNLQAEFVLQTPRAGSGHALWVARHTFDKADEIIIFFGDTIVDADIPHLVNSRQSCLAVKKVSDPRAFGIVELKNDGKSIHRLLEKPRIPKSDLAMVGIYKIREVQLLIDALDFNVGKDIKTNGEFPLTDALMRMIEKDVRFDIFTVDNWFDCGQREVLLETNATFLDREGYATDAPPLENSIFIHPVSIGANCQISNSIIGPHVTVGNNVRIDNAILTNSIIGNYTSIQEAVLQKSVIGNDTSITGLRQSLNIGDNTEIDFSHG